MCIFKSAVYFLLWVFADVKIRLVEMLLCNRLTVGFPGK